MTIERRLARVGFTLTRGYPFLSSASGTRSPTRTRSGAGTAPATPVSPVSGRSTFASADATSTMTFY
ncbi:hypothetical protein [Cryobacterium sp. Y82]|uniref:hypothetical protein n=1 Tax=Cryobacterium sp. Y82 TaxID=2045017 RepID=UPI001E5ADAAB|nr:hypothetical protein [Cryobacterium sp. Y82]